MKLLKVAASLLTSLLIVSVAGIVLVVTDNYCAASALQIESDEVLAVQDIEYKIEPPKQNLSADLKSQIDTNVEIMLHEDDPEVIDNAESSETSEYYEIYEEPITYESQEYYQEPEIVEAEPASSVDWSSYSTYHPTDGLTPEGGVNFYDNGSGERMETAYSSNVLYHYRTNEWTVDDEGFYHDSEGRYVVAASDMEQGTIFETSKGEAIVLDCGCDPGVTDFYVNW